MQSRSNLPPRPNIAFCPTCHAAKEPNETICPNCGTRSCPNGHAMSAGSRVCSRCGWVDRNWKPHMAGPQEVIVHKTSQPQESQPGTVCPNCKAAADFTTGRCTNCGYIFSTSTFYGAHHEQHTPPQPGGVHPSTQFEQFTVQQQSPGTHDAKLDYSCPRCSARIDPSSGRCPNCGYMGSMEYEIPSKHIPGVTPAPPPPPPQPKQQSYNVQQFQEVHQSAPQRTCPECGNPISPDSRICPHCGGYCGTGRNQTSRHQGLSTLERANMMAASAPISSHVESSPYMQHVSYPASAPSAGSYAPERSIPISDRTLKEEKKKGKVKDTGHPRQRKAFPMGLMAAVVVVAVLMVIMVIIVIRNEMADTSLRRDLTTPSTPVVDTTPPVLSDIRATNVTETGVTIKWTTDEKSTSEVQLCEGDLCHPLQGDTENLVKNHSVEITDLSRSTTYHVTVYSKDESGNEVESTTDVTFTTGMQSDTDAPLIEMKAVSGITDVSAVINWTTNENSTSQVEYGKTASYGKESALDSTLTLTHKVTLTGLESNTTYHYRVISIDSSGNTISFDEDRTFTTLAAADEGTGVGNRAPDFDLESLDDQYISLSQYRGKIVVLNFWYVTCNPCIEEMPYFQDLQEQWSGDEDIVILAVNYQNDPGTVQDFIDIGQYTFTVLLDTDGAVGAQFANLFPTTYFIDADGVIQYKKEGNFGNLAEIISVLESME